MYESDRPYTPESARRARVQHLATTLRDEGHSDAADVLLDLLGALEAAEHASRLNPLRHLDPRDLPRI
jgi:hypothetical protein